MPPAGTGSGLNASKTFFSALTRRRLERGDFRSTVELRAAINRCLAERDRDPEPCARTRRADQILTQINRLNASLHA